MAVLVAAGCAHVETARQEPALTSGVVPAFAPQSRPGPPAGLEALVAITSDPSGVDTTAMLRALADALDGMQEVRFAITAFAVRADADRLERSRRDETLIVMDALGATVRAMADVTRTPSTTEAVRDAVDAGWASVRAIRAGRAARTQRQTIDRAFREVTRALVSVASAPA
jgi:hypothetical protein